jgi:DNA-binding response OmpR family regulator
MSGMELIRHLRTRAQRLPILLLFARCQLAGQGGRFGRAG